jgi:uncharacterized protein (DUF433 family)
MNNYRPDPKNPRQLTPEEARRLDAARIDYSDIPPLGDEFFSQAKRAAMIDWTKCQDVESVPGRCHGAPVVKGTRVIVESCILGNADDYSAEEVADMFAVPVEVVVRILRFAYQSEITAIIGPAEPPWPAFTAEAKARLDTLVRKVLALRHTIPKEG